MRRLVLLVLALATGCTSAPPPPDWKMNAASALETYTKRWLEGQGKAAEASFNRARSEIARTGQLHLAARAELIRCATHVASLDFSPCMGFEALAPHASSEDAAYARFLAGDWQGIETHLLADHYSQLAGTPDAIRQNQAAQAIPEPLPRLIAAALLFRSGQITPETMASAVETASEQGWRRPLLAWLMIQRKRAEAAGDHVAVKRLARRIELVQESMPRAPGTPTGSGSLTP